MAATGMQGAGRDDDGGGEPTSMMTAVDCLSLLVSDAPQETWGQAGTWLVPSEARAQAPICSTGVFLLTRLKLWDLEHTLGCRDKIRSTQGTAKQTAGQRCPWLPLPPEQTSPLHLRPPVFPSPHLSAGSGLVENTGCPRDTKSLLRVLSWAWCVPLARYDRE